MEYEVHPIEFSKGVQRAPDFPKIGPNNKISVIVDRDNDHSVMESDAIMIYLAEKYGNFLPADPLKRSEVMEWLMWQMGGLGQSAVRPLPICTSIPVKPLSRKNTQGRSRPALWCP